MFAAVVRGIPLTAAVLTQRAAVASRWAAALQERALRAMVPVMMLTLAVVVASQIHGVGARLGALVGPAVLYVVFAAVALPAGYDLAPLVVVTQTLVEMVVMVVFVRWVPRLVWAPGLRPAG